MTTKILNNFDVFHNLSCIKQKVVTVDLQKITRAVLVFATEHKNNVDPRLRSQKKVNYVNLPSNWCTTNVSNIYE